MLAIMQTSMYLTQFFHLTLLVIMRNIIPAQPKLKTCNKAGLNTQWLKMMEKQ